MSTPNSRWPGRASLPPASPTLIASPLHARTDSFAEPKSELLRHAMDAQRARQSTPVQVPADPIFSHPHSLKKVTSDPWMDNARSEEDSTRTTPVRRPRRPSEGALPRPRTQREIQTENDTLRNAQIDLRMRLQLLSEQNNKLLDQAERDQERIKELEPLEDRVHDLQEANTQLTIKMQDWEDEIVHLHEQNEEILKISGETVLNMEKTEEALHEAAGIIVSLENDKAALLEELEQLRKQVAHIQTEPKDDAADTCAATNGHYPARVHSIDESRPSTGNFDSDYYSMPASPHDRPSQDSLEFVSDRAKKFITMRKDAQRSNKDLHKRLSNASLKQKKKKEEPAPQIPQIPAAFKQRPVSAGPNRTPRRVASLRPSPSPLSPALNFDPYASKQSGSAPQTPNGGLRGHFQSGLTLDTSSRHSRHSSHHSNITVSPLASKGAKPARAEPPVTPARFSSRAAPTSCSSAEQLKTQSAPQSESEAASEAGTETTWGLPPSIVSEDLTTELDANFRGPWYSQISSWGANLIIPGAYPSSGTESTAGTKSTSRPVQQRSASYAEANFLFNPAEDEDDFIEKTQTLGRRKR